MKIGSFVRRQWFKWVKGIDLEGLYDYDVSFLRRELKHLKEFHKLNSKWHYTDGTVPRAIGVIERMLEIGGFDEIEEYLQLKEELFKFYLENFDKLWV